MPISFPVIVEDPSRQVAFSVYLDHRTVSLGKDQAIVYNQVLLNKGNAYNKFSGMFTAPASGVYLFSWSAAASGAPGLAAYDIWLSLVINDVIQTTAVAESRTDYDDHQGSATAVLHLNQGDIAWIKHLYGTGVFSGSTHRVTTFTGALLFADAM